MNFFGTQKPQRKTDLLTLEGFVQFHGSVRPQSFPEFPIDGVQDLRIRLCQLLQLLFVFYRIPHRKYNPDVLIFVHISQLRIQDTLIIHTEPDTWVSGKKEIGRIRPNAPITLIIAKPPFLRQHRLSATQIFLYSSQVHTSYFVHFSGLRPDGFYVNLITTNHPDNALISSGSSVQGHPASGRFEWYPVGSCRKRPCLNPQKER